MQGELGAQALLICCKVTSPPPPEAVGGQVPREVLYIAFNLLYFWFIFNTDNAVMSWKVHINNCKGPFYTGVAGGCCSPSLLVLQIDVLES